MPTYEYRCKSCGYELEVQQAFSDDPLDTCPECEGPLRKVYGNVGIAFKGSGFYKNDARGKKSSAVSSSSTSSSDSSSSSDSGSKDSGSKDSGSKDSGSKDGGTKKADKTEKKSTPTSSSD